MWSVQSSGFRRRATGREPGASGMVRGGSRVRVLRRQSIGIAVVPRRERPGWPVSSSRRRHVVHRHHQHPRRHHGPRAGARQGAIQRLPPPAAQVPWAVVVGGDAATLARAFHPRRPAPGFGGAPHAVWRPAYPHRPRRALVHSPQRVEASVSRIIAHTVHIRGHLSLVGDARPYMIQNTG